MEAEENKVFRAWKAASALGVQVNGMEVEVSLVRVAATLLKSLMNLRKKLAKPINLCSCFLVVGCGHSVTPLIFSESVFTCPLWMM